MLNGVIDTAKKVMKRNPVENPEWLDTLSGMTELEALIVIKDQLVETDFLSLIGLKKKINFVLNLDENTYKKSKRITHNYLIKLKNSKEVKDDIQLIMYEYHRQLYTAYSQILDAYQAQKKVKLSLAKTNLLLARYLNATFMMAKWRYFDDQSAPAGVWKNVHKVIKLAEELAVINKNLFLYSFQVKETSVATLLKRGFMVDTLHKGNYSQLEIELTDRVLKIWGTNPLIVNTYKPDRYHFFIKLEDDHGPDRVRMKEKFAECRYWRTTRLIDLMEAYLCAANMQKPLREFGLEKIAPTSVVLKLFKKLRIDWCAEGYERQRRVEERHQKHTLLSVSYGLEAIHKRLADMDAMQAKEAAETQGEDAGFTFELNTGADSSRQNKAKSKVPTLYAENWWMVDESESGFAVDFGKEPPSFMEVGLLVAYSEEGYQSTLTIAEVKSIKKLPSGAYRAGFKKISHNLTAVQIRSESKTTVKQPVSGFYVDEGQETVNYSPEFAALLVDNDANNNPKLLIPRAQFKRGGHFSIEVEGESHSITAGKIVAKHNRWIIFDALI